MKKILWALIDDRMGSVNVIRGILPLLDGDKYEIVEKKIAYNRWAKLPNFIKGASFIGITAESKMELNGFSVIQSCPDSTASSSFRGHKVTVESRMPLNDGRHEISTAEQMPDVVISATRRSASIARGIKKKSQGKTKIVQMLHPGPGSSLSDFELIFVPEHDKSKKHSPNIIYTVGSPTRTTDKALAEAREKWEPIFANLPRPWTTVIIGGAVKGKPFSLENAQAVARAVAELKRKTGGSILITDSWRTGEEPRQKIMNILKMIPAYTYLWGEKKDNPYMGYLACADNLVVTGDSVSMSCEACGTGKPVYIFTGKDWLTPKQMRFVQSLYDNGYAIAMESPNRDNFKGGKRLNAAYDVASKINQLF